MVQVLEGLLPLASGEGLSCLGHGFPLELVVEQAAEAPATDLRALTDAFAEVCSERTGLPPEAVLAFWVPEMAAALEGARHWIGGLEADARWLPSIRRVQATPHPMWTAEMFAGRIPARRSGTAAAARAVGRKPADPFGL